MEPYGPPKGPDPDPLRPNFLPDSPLPPDPPTPRPPIKHSSIAAILFLFSVLGLVIAGAYFSGELQQFMDGPNATQSQQPRPGLVPFGQRQDPLPGLEEADAPLGTPPPVSRPSNSYKFLAVKDDGIPSGLLPMPADPLRGEFRSGIRFMAAPGGRSRPACRYGHRLEIHLRRSKLRGPHDKQGRIPARPVRGPVGSCAHCVEHA
jgi:hypothetical protein